MGCDEGFGLDGGWQGGAMEGFAGVAQLVLEGWLEGVRIEGPKEGPAWF